MLFTFFSVLSPYFFHVVLTISSLFAFKSTHVILPPRIVSLQGWNNVETTRKIAQAPFARDLEKKIPG